MIPHRTPFILPLLYPSLTWRINSAVKDIYLTFDDGPMDGCTEFVLDHLERFSIPATFFCIGQNIVRHPHIFKRILEGGHSIGNHTVNHANGFKCRTPEYLASVRDFDRIATSAGLVRGVKLFRPPYGCITRKQIRGLHDYRIIMWDVLTQDYDRRLSPEACLRGSIRACRPGSIVVFHDSHKAERNMEYALPRLIEHLVKEGFNFKAL